jgi:RimJ/RimL family protein N-acetyltransferase
MLIAVIRWRAGQLPRTAGWRWAGLTCASSATALLMWAILSRMCWGQGLGREALAAVVSHGFGPMGLRRIAADTDPDNRGSIAVLRSLGFVQEGHLRGEWKTHIGVRDSLIFGLLAGEWDTP